MPLLIVHVRPLTRQIDEETGRREAEELLAESVRRSAIVAPALRPSTLAPLDFPSAALVSLARDASMVVVGSRGLGGFRSLMTGSNSLATASMASCPVVIVRDDRPEGDGDRDAEAPARTDIVAGVAADEKQRGGPGVRLRHRGIPSRGPAADRARLDDVLLDARGRARPGPRGGGGLGGPDAGRSDLLGWHERYPQVEIVREPVNGSASRTLAAASATAALTVTGPLRAASRSGWGCPRWPRRR
ncbi:universal stress protein [Streptomyces californicus]